MNLSPNPKVFRSSPRCCLVVLLTLLCFIITSPGETSEGPTKVRKQEDESLLREVRLPRDPARGPDEQYYHRFVIRTEQGETFIGAYWRQDGSYLAVALDIFAVEHSPSGLVARLLHTEGLGGEISKLHVMDIDRDERDDLLFVHQTGGMIATTGVTLLLQTSTGFSNAFFTAGSDVLIYRDRGGVRILVKAPTPKEVEVFSWNPSKKTFEVSDTFDLLY